MSFALASRSNDGASKPKNKAKTMNEATHSKTPWPTSPPARKGFQGMGRL